MIEPCSRRGECPYVIDAMNRAELAEAQCVAAKAFLNATDLPSRYTRHKTKAFDEYGRRLYAAPSMESSNLHGGKVVKTP